MSETEHGSARFRLDRHQLLGINLALTRFITKAKKRFLLVNGTDFVKAARLLVIADQYYRRTGKPVLLVTMSGAIIEGRCRADACALGIDLANNPPIRFEKYTNLLPPLRSDRRLSQCPSPNPHLRIRHRRPDAPGRNHPGGWR